MKQKEKGYRRNYIKRIDQLVKDATETAKNILFEDLNRQKFKLFKIVIQLVNKYIELAKIEKEET